MEKVTMVQDKRIKEYKVLRMEYNRDGDEG